MTSVNSRVNALALGCVLLLMTLVVRLLWLQTVERQQFVERAEGQRIRVEVVVPVRGRVFDRTGSIVLVDNRVVRRVSVVRREFLAGKRNATKRAEIIARLGTLLGRSPAELSAKVDDIRANDLSPIELARDVPERVVVQIEERAEEFPGVVLDETTERVYPLGRLASHVLGYVGPVSENDLRARPETALYGAGQRIGRSGVEQSYESVLRGQAGEFQLLVDKNQRVLERREIRPVIAGRDIRLTIDVDLQREAEEAIVTMLTQARRERAKLFLPKEKNTPETYLRAEAGTAVVLDVKDGSVLAMASVPDYAPQDFVNGISQDEFARLTSEEQGRPLVNRAIAGLYLPGSTFKLVTSYAALRSGVVTTSSVIQDTGKYLIETCNPREDDCERQNAGASTYGPVDLRRSLTVSSDVYYYRIGDRLWNSGDPTKKEAIQTFGEELGLGKRTGIALGSESTAQLPTPERRRALWERNPDAFPNGDRWRTGDNLNVAIGQGEVLVTPLALDRAYATFANGGAVMTPKIVIDDDTTGLASVAASTATTRSRDVSASTTSTTAEPTVPTDSSTTTAPAPDASTSDPATPDATAVGDALATTTTVPLAPSTTVASWVAVSAGPPQVTGQAQIEDNYRSAIIDGLVGAVSRRGGTAQDAFAGFPLGRFPIAGKTGTAQQVGKHDSALFAGFGPVNDPQFAVVVVMEQAGYGGQAAAPVARRIFEVLAGAPRTPVRYAPRDTTEGR